MPRLNVIDPADAEGRVKEIFEGPLKGKHFNIFKGLANSPAALETYIAINGALSDSALTPAEKEAVALVVGESNNCDYCVAAHSALGKQAGLNESQVTGARKGHVEGDDRMDALVKFAMRIQEKKGWVSDEDVKNFKGAGYTDGHIAEVVAVYALNLFTNYFNHINETDVDFPAAPKL